MANSFDKKYEKNIAGLATTNNVDTGTAAAMLRSNLAGTSSYKGGGVLDFNAAKKDLDSYLGSSESRGNSGGSGSSGATDYASVLADIERQNELALKNQRKAIEASIKQGTKQINAQKEDVNQAYEDANTDASVWKSQQLNMAPEQLARMGLFGTGQAETSLSDINMAYGNTLNTNKQNNIKALSDLDLAIANLRSTGDISIAEKAAEIAQTMPGIYMSIANAIQYQSESDRSFSASEDQRAIDNAYRNTAFDYQKSQDALDQENWMKEFALASSKSSGGGESTKPTLTYSQVKQLYADGVRTPQVLSAWKYYTGKEYASDQYVGYNFTGEAKTVDERLAALTIPSSKVALIETYNKQGKITDEDAVALLKKYALAR